MSKRDPNSVLVLVQQRQRITTATAPITDMMTTMITLPQRGMAKKNQRQQLIDNWQSPHRQQQLHFDPFLVSTFTMN